jgi:hypothetical protein
VSRVFLSHSSRDSRQAAAVKKWLIEQEPGLVDEIYLDVDPHGPTKRPSAKAGSWSSIGPRDTRNFGTTSTSSLIWGSPRWLIGYPTER